MFSFCYVFVTATGERSKCLGYYTFKYAVVDLNVPAWLPNV